MSDANFINVYNEVILENLKCDYETEFHVSNADEVFRRES
jgi:hypothetical protein